MDFQSRFWKSAGRSLKSAVQQSSVRRAAKVRLLHGKNCSARQQIFMRKPQFGKCKLKQKKSLRCMGGIWSANNKIILSSDLFLYNFFSKRRKGQFCQFEMLYSKRYSDDGNAQQQSETDVCKENPESSDKKPNHVHDKTQASV